MFYEESKLTINQQYAVENDIEVDHDGQCQLITLLFPEYEEIPYETKVPLSLVLNNIVDYYSEVRSSEGGHMQLYSMAHEFSRYADELRTLADSLSDEVNLGYTQLDLFYDED